VNGLSKGACWSLLWLLLAALVTGCGEGDGGRYVVRQEFDALSQRVTALETTVTGLTGSTLPGAASRTKGGQAAAAQASGSEKALYQQGQSFLKQKRYDQAAAVFEQMLSRSPGGRLAPNARYWLGECHYAQGRWHQAAAEFLRCVNDYPQSEKAPDSLLKLSYCYDRLGQGPQAMAELDRLLSQYPRSNAAAMIKNGRGRFNG
jgi:tol-pal system protein YbgF